LNLVEVRSLGAATGTSGPSLGSASIWIVPFPTSGGATPRQLARIARMISAASGRGVRACPIADFKLLGCSAVYRTEQRGPRQYRSQRATVPVRIMAQDKSPIPGAPHQAAVRDPPAEPIERHWRRGPLTSICPSCDCPNEPPRKRTSLFRASSAEAVGHGWPGRQVPSISRAAMPARRIFGPSAHHIGPSPSQTRTGMQVKATPAAKTGIIVIA
jgi:hypothetical protein